MEYPEDLINSEMRKVKFSNLRLKSHDKKHDVKGIQLAVTDHPLLKSLSTIIDKNLSILYMDKDGYLPLGLWFHFVVLVNEIATCLGQNYIC